MYERFFLEMNNYVIGIVSRNYEIDHKKIHFKEAGGDAGNLMRISAVRSIFYVI